MYLRFNASVSAILKMSLSCHQALVIMETFLLTIRPDLPLYLYL